MTTPRLMGKAVRIGRIVGIAIGSLVAVLGEQLGQVRVVGARIGGPGELDHPGANRLVDPAPGCPAPVPVDEHRRTLRGEPRPETPDRALRGTEDHRHLVHRELAAQEPRQGPCASLVSRRHRDRLLHPWRPTKSLISWH